MSLIVVSKIIINLPKTIKIRHMKKLIIFSLFILFLIVSFNAVSQEVDTAYDFKVIYENPATSVKNQSRSGTCWDFAAISFLESELIRKGKGEHDLSEMYIVRTVYPVKANNYVRLHGKANFSMGGQAHDVTDMIGEYGIVPESVYPAKESEEDELNHGEMDAVLKGFCQTVIKKRGGKITSKWDDAFEEVLDVYLGEIPESFEVNSKEYTPVEYAAELDINAENYIELTSYTHYPYNEKVILKIPDNWSDNGYYNLDLDDFIRVMKHALENGYTFVWDGDVSDKYFSFKDGVAIVPGKEWDDKTEEEKKQTCKSPEPQKEITSEIRQEVYDNQTANDEHLMHITGLVEDQNGIQYFKTKNSWGTKRNDFGGYLNMSEPYIRLKTIAIMINKEALPKDIAKKLGII